MRLHFEEGERETITASLGLAEDATDEAIAQAVAERLTREPQANNGGDGGGSGNGSDDETEDDDDDDIDASQGDVVVVDVTEFARLKKREKQAGAIEAAERIRDRDELIEGAIHDGKFGPGRRQHYKDRYDSDPEGTKKLIARLQKHTVPLDERGADEPTDEVDASAYPKEWLSPGEQGLSRGQEPVKRNRVSGEV